MNSILIHTNNFNEKVICLNIDLDEASKNECLNVYNKIEFLDLDPSNYESLPQHAPALKNAFFKLEFFKLAQNYERLIFIDLDIVFIDSINELLNTIPKNNMSIVYHERYKCYNTGVMIFNKCNPLIYNNIIKLLKTMKIAHLADQSVIERAIRLKFIKVDKLDGKWNTTKRDILKDHRKSYVGIHFVGKKPWSGGEKDYEKIEAIWRKYSL